MFFTSLQQIVTVEVSSSTSAPTNFSAQALSLRLGSLEHGYRSSFRLLKVMLRVWVVFRSYWELFG